MLGVQIQLGGQVVEYVLEERLNSRVRIASLMQEQFDLHGLWRVSPDVNAEFLL